MAKSQKPRKPKGTRRKARLPLPPIETVGRSHRIRPHIFNKLRDNEDFINLVRAGRVLNALTYMMQLIVETPPVEKSASALRRFHRNTINSAGYLYEAYCVIENISYKYIKEPSFAQFAEILGHPDKARRKGLMKLIRNCAFHLDESADATKKALAKLNLKFYALVSADDDELGSLYFDLADDVDLNFILDELVVKNPGTEESVLRDEIFTLIPELIGDFSRAADSFVQGLARRLRLTN